MTVCTACGRENPADARFCNACGVALHAEAPAREERKIVSVLFVDLVGFTARAERLDPEDVRAIQTPYFQRVRAEIEAFGGTVEKFIGDAVMAVFGAPVAYGDDPERAVRAALSIRAAVAELNQRDPALDLRVRLAVNTGEAIVSVTSDPSSGEGSVAGDVVNTASRLQTAAPVDGILAGEETYRCTRSVIRYDAIEPVTVKGKEAPVRAWLALEPSEQPGSRPTGRVPLIGRDNELAVLDGIWTRVVGEGRPTLVTVFGPAGVGKTRLALEFGTLVERDGGRGIRGRCVPYGETATYGAFAQHVKQLAHIFDSDLNADAWTKLRATVGELITDADSDQVAADVARLIGLDVEDGADDRHSLFFSARRLLEAVARVQPTVLVFEDVHWADAAMLDLLQVLASRVRDVPLLLLALARPELLESHPAWGGGLPGYTALPLEPLDSRHAAALAGELLAAVRERSGDAASIAAAAEGNPLFIEELAASLGERATSSTGELPTSIRAIVSARIDALPAAERAVLRDASVVGKVFWRGALAAMKSGGDELSELLDSLEGRDLIRREPVSRLLGDQQFSFKHVLIRDIAYGTLPRPDRRERHEAVAGFLEHATPEVHAAASALAHHWQEAGDDVRAADYLTVAGDQAGRGWAKAEAVAFYRQALALVPEEDTDRLRGLSRRLAVALQAAYHVTDAELLGRRPAGQPADAQA